MGKDDFDLIIDEAMRIINGEIELADSWVSNLEEDN